MSIKLFDYFYHLTYNIDNSEYLSIKPTKERSWLHDPENDLQLKLAIDCMPIRLSWTNGLLNQILYDC